MMLTSRRKHLMNQTRLAIAIFLLSLGVTATTGTAATVLPVGPITFENASDYDSNFKELATGTGFNFVSPANLVQLTTTGTTITLFDMGATGGAGGMGGTGGTDLNNDLDNFSVIMDVSRSGTAGNRSIGYFVRLDNNEANGYMARMKFNDDNTNVSFEVFKVGATIGSLSNIFASGNISVGLGAIPVNELRRLSLTVDGPTFTFDFDNGMATASFTDPTPNLSAGQVGIRSRISSGAGNNRFDNFRIKAISADNILANYAVLDGSLTSSDADSSTAGNLTLSGGDFGASGSSDMVFARSNHVAGTDAASAIAEGDYFSFTVTPDSGTPLDLTTLEFDQGGSTNGAGFNASVVVKSSVGGFGVGDPTLATFTKLVTGDAASGKAELIPRTIDLSSLSDISSPVEFRIYLYDDANNSGLINRIDNVTLRGVAVPEPSSIALLITALAACVGLRLRKKC